MVEQDQNRLVKNDEGNNSVNPYLITTLLYFFVALLGALQSALILAEIMDRSQAIPWVRVHFITLGILTQIIVGYTPRIINSEEGTKTRWDIWILLNLGLLTFFYGRTLMDNDIMITGGILVFISISLFIHQLFTLEENRGAKIYTSNFYIMGSVYFLVGILLGTGIWVGWDDFLGVTNILEAHIHANNWGFMTLFFTGIFLDNYKSIFGVDYPRPNRVMPIFIAQAIGAGTLILGPWIGNNPISVIGMIAFLIGTGLLLIDVVGSMKSIEKQVGHYHLIVAYVWIVIPLIFAPFVITGAEGFEFVENMAPQALIYGWVLQVGFALLYYFILKQRDPSNTILGGNWISLVLVNLGGILLWVAIFAGNFRETMHSIAYILWFLAMIPIIHQNFKLISKN